MNIPIVTQLYLEHGAPEGDRNDSLMAAACQMRDAGYSKDAAETILISRAVQDGLSGHEAERTITSAYNREPKRAITGKKIMNPYKNLHYNNWFCELEWMQRGYDEDYPKQCYQEFLKSPEWHRLREYALVLRPFCYDCGMIATQVHHKTYDNGWLCPIDNLESLCAQCHEGKHA